MTNFIETGLTHGKMRLDALTSLRFFAAAMIVFGHAHGLFGSLGLALNFSLAQGVSFFFVLSGFILTYNYPNVETGLFSFYKARFARLWPLHIVALLAVPTITGMWNIAGLNPLGVAYVLVGNVLLIQSWIPFRDSYLTFNGVAWSISTEAFFYVVFPMALIGLRRAWGLVLALVVLLTILFLWLVVRYEIPMDVNTSTLNAMGMIYTNPIARLSEFVLGMIACKVFMYVGKTDHSSITSWTVVEVAIVCLIALSMHLTPRLPLGVILPQQWVPVVQYFLIGSGSAPVFAIAVVVFAFGRGLVSKVLAFPVLVFLGEASFALYLFHATILFWFEQHLSLAQSSFGVFLFWGSVLAMASAAHLWIEKPCRSFIMGRGHRRKALVPA
ncbi:acyltransferase [Variovorax humicola]|uniref:Acyltransferase n=1 Tax=Variovorax humicola TaxID=1769758 RepID=A0ABU8VUD8_9BURK